jgi:hypothetical protein
MLTALTPTPWPLQFLLQPIEGPTEPIRFLSPSPFLQLLLADLLAQIRCPYQ